MRLTVKNEFKGSTVDQASPGYTIKRGGRSAGRDDGRRDNRLVLTTAIRALQGSARELGEMLLQLLSGVEPYVPRMRVRESSRALIVTGHLARVEETSVDVVYDGYALLISGEKIGQRERVGRSYRRVEIVSRRFERRIPLYCEVDAERILATLRDDVLRIHLPKKTLAIHGNAGTAGTSIEPIRRAAPR